MKRLLRWENSGGKKFLKREVRSEKTFFFFKSFARINKLFHPHILKNIKFLVRKKSFSERKKTFPSEIKVSQSEKVSQWEKIFLIKKKRDKKLHIFLPIFWKQT